MNCAAYIQPPAAISRIIYPCGLSFEDSDIVIVLGLSRRAEKEEKRR